MDNVLAHSQSLDMEQVRAIDLSGFNNKSLQTLFEQSLTVTAKNLLLMGKIWRELESRGVDLDHLRHGLANYLSWIGEGRIIPELVIKFAGNKMLLKEMALMPCAEQERMADDSATVVYAEIDSVTGCVTRREVSAEHLNSRYISRVFNNGRIRNYAEQAKMLEKLSLKGKRKNKAPKKYRRSISLDRDLGVMRISNMDVLLSDVIAALCSGTDTTPNDLSSILGIKNEQ